MQLLVSAPYIAVVHVALTHSLSVQSTRIGQQEWAKSCYYMIIVSQGLRRADITYRPGSIITHVTRFRLTYLLTWY